MEHLTIKRAKNEILKAQNELDVYLTKKKINFIRQLPGSSKMKDTMVDSSRVIFDKFTQYVIRDEELDEKITSLLETINAYEKFIIEETKRLQKYDEVGLIYYLKEEKGLSWKEIDKALHRSEDYSRLKYNRAKAKEKEQNKLNDTIYSVSR